MWDLKHAFLLLSLFLSTIAGVMANVSVKAQRVYISGFLVTAQICHCSKVEPAVCNQIEMFVF